MRQEDFDALVEKNNLTLKEVRMKKQTAVEWLVEQILPTISETLSDVCIKELIEIAKALEKEQIMDAYKQCENSNISWQCDGAQDYYTSTFGS
jgi:hypothetical protein